jgi:acyl carrier protein
MKDIRKRITRIIATELEISPNDIDDNTQLIDLGLDSLSFLEMIAEFKDEFNVTVSIHELSHYLKEHPIRTVGMLVRYVEELLVHETNEIRV